MFFFYLQMATADGKHDLEIPVWVKGTQKWVTGLTKRTTCDDVIYALLYQDGNQDRTSEYAIFEKWREVERPLQGRTKIVKIWRTWGAEQSNVHFAMRRIDELEYSGDFSLTRRKKRSRHRTRERDRDRSSRDHHRHHSYCHNTSERLRSMENLVKLVISQERKLKDFKEQIDDTNKLIDRYESRVHMKRLKQNGEDYVQDAYLESYSEDSMDDVFASVDPDTLEKYLELCDKVIALEDKIVNEHLKIDDLSNQIQQGYMNANSGDISEEQDQVNKVQVELNRAVSCAIMQQYKFQDVQRELHFYEDKSRHKEKIIQRLQEELNTLESKEPEIRPKLDSASSNSSLESYQSSGFGDVKHKNPLPLPEKKPLPLPERTIPPPVPERIRLKNPVPDPIPDSPPEPLPERKPILKSVNSDSKNGYYNSTQKQTPANENKVRFNTESLVDKYCWDESSLSEGISIDHSDCSDMRDPFDIVIRKDTNSLFPSGIASKPYHTVKVEDNDSNSDTGLSSMHSDDSAVYHLETLV